MKIFVQISIISLISIVLAVIFFLAFNMPLRSKVLKKSCDSNTYDKNAQYCLYVVQRSKLLSSELEIVVSRNQGDEVPGYGHFVNYPFKTNMYTDAVDKVKESQVDWLKEGVMFKATTGHQLLIPKEEFLGGR